MKRIQLGNTVFEGRNNVYVLDGETTALVDAGVATPNARDQLRAGLADYGLSFADVDEIFVTHWHYDHAGLAGEIQSESGATVRAHEADAPLVAGEESAVAAENERLAARLREWNLPDDAREGLLDYLERHADLAGEPADVTPFADGDAFEVNGRTYEAVHLPGHAAGLCAFAFEADEAPGEQAADAGGAPAGEDDEIAPAEKGGEEAFVGDAILPKYTPNVGGADVRVDAPLATYADSLVRLAERDPDRAWPGHRDRIDDPAGRAATILEHHRERTRNVIGVLAERGPCDAWTVSAHLFGELRDIHVLHGPGEAYAHLDHLRATGVVERDGRDYELVDHDPDVDALFPRIDG
ncbi:MBL fold metallo-hydrolase [Halegenticoccus soli]|uniref:MBL fold metallo-hydrolase n=1 Tax=Halegenticoccus soli TaxID=1985678 RepID=UPI000C6DFA89|nr:MBL fold metallo-hydrolase [Halegenticoccus soli]